MARLLVHAGFHKTGTTSLQALLRENARRLPDGIRVVPQDHPDFRDLRQTTNDPRAHPISISTSMDLMLEALAPAPDETLLISAEALAGPLPRPLPKHPLYHRTAAIADALVAGTGRHDVTLIYGVRDEDAWRRSWHAHLRLWRETVPGFEEVMANPYVARFDFDRVLREVRAAVSVPILSIALEEDAEAVLGPGTAFLRLAGLDDDDLAALTPVPARNTKPPFWASPLLHPAVRSLMPRDLVVRFKRRVTR